VTTVSTKTTGITRASYLYKWLDFHGTIIEVLLVDFPASSRALEIMGIGSGESSPSMAELFRVVKYYGRTTQIFMDVYGDILETPGMFNLGGAFQWGDTTYQLVI